MELSELTAYAKEKYNIDEQHKWPEFPGFSVLSDPLSGKWAALLMRGYDAGTGEITECCDVKCGQEMIAEIDRKYVTAPFRMHGPKWAGITFGIKTEAAVVRKLFDSAMDNIKGSGFTVVLHSPASRNSTGVNIYGSVPIPLRSTAGGQTPSGRDIVPERIRKLRLLFRPDTYSMTRIAEDFYRQAMFMRDYEDDHPWTGNFNRIYPTYHQLTTPQLRGYFSWRTRVRKGEFTPISISAAYIYLYELLNGIGAPSAAEKLRKMEEFEKGFIDAGYGDEYMRRNLRQWMTAVAIINGLPPDVIGKYARDAGNPYCDGLLLSVLMTPDAHNDEELFRALSKFDAEKRLSSEIFSSFGSRGKFLAAESWRIAAGNYVKDGKDLFTLCFGEMREQGWFPFSNAIYCRRDDMPDGTVKLGGACYFTCRNKRWSVFTYFGPVFDRGLIKRFLHALDLKLRNYLKAGAKLREKPGEDWAYPYIDEAIARDKKREAERRRESVNVDLSGLDKIRADAEVTRDSLLTEDEIADGSAEITPVTRAAPAPETSGCKPVSAKAFTENIPLTQAPTQEYETPAPVLPDPVLRKAVRMLLRSEDPRAILLSNSVLPEIAADSINEALFDEFGDNVVFCEDGHLSLVIEYAEDLKLMLDNNPTETL